jgi:hypothetical protein
MFAQPPAFRAILDIYIESQRHAFEQRPEPKRTVGFALNFRQTLKLRRDCKMKKQINQSSTTGHGIAIPGDANRPTGRT